MIKAIIFDMDGVLIDSHPVHRLAWRKFLASIGKNVSDEDLGFILEGRRREEILHHFLGDLPNATIAEYGRQKDRYFEENFRGIKLTPGVREFLTNLAEADLAVAIATSASASRTYGTLRRLGLENRFATIVTGDDVDAGKPDPAVYRLAAHRMRLEPHDLVVFEDAPCGVEAAIAAGMRCIGVNIDSRAEMLLQSGAEFVIPNFVGFTFDVLIESAS